VLHLTDSLTGERRPFEPRDPGKAGLYWCGPTVYDVPHVGHARSALCFDILARYLAWSGYEVTSARNVTDIDDQIINRANKEGTTHEAISATYLDAYLHELDRLNILRPTVQPKATEYVQQMIDFIATLIDRDMAYVIDSGVYFDVPKLDGYGALPHRTADELREGAGARVEVDDDKRDPLDFALWKAAKPDEPTWDSPWGPGRPGWHIECVAMSLDVLGAGFDVHGGGDDLTFPHHENERAEAVGAGHEFARSWVHNGMVNVNGEKMSKSLGNYTTLAGNLDAHDPRALRMLVLQTHYRKTMEIDAASLESASAAVDRLDAMKRRADAAGIVLTDERNGPTTEAFRSAMDDDLGTPAALAAVFDAVRAANAALDRGDDSAEALVSTVIDLASVLGFTFGAVEVSDGDSDIDTLVAARDEAKANKDYATADQIRDELTSQGIIIEDTPTGTIWRRA
jgi:cysteinyl-tRNA synthetase